MTRFQDHFVAFIAAVAIVVVTWVPVVTVPADPMTVGAPALA